MCYGVAIAVTAGFDIDPGHSHMAFSMMYLSKSHARYK